MPKSTSEPVTGGPKADQFQNPDLSPGQKRRKHRLERGAIAITAASLLILTLIQREVIDLGPGLSDSQGLVALVSINVSVLLTTLLILLILRQLYRVFFEKHGYGSLQTKMIVAFICLSLLPTILIFYYSYRQLVRGHDLWFSPLIEEALKDSVELSDAVLAMDARFLSAYGGDILDSFSQMTPPVDLTDLIEILETGRQRFHLTTVELYNPAGQLAARAGNEALPPIYHEWFSRQLGSGPPWNNTVETASGDLTRLVWPIFTPSNEEGDKPSGYLVVGRLTLSPIRSQMEDVRPALIGYQAALRVRRPFRVTQLTALTALAVLAVVISVWIGAHLARSLSRPVTDLVEGTKIVAGGNLDFILPPQGRSGEFAELVSSFNQMTTDLKELYGELDSRRRFVETVLRNVSTGVIILEVDGRPRSLNQAAVDILSDEKPALDDQTPVEPGRLIARDNLELPAPLADLVEEMLNSPESGRRVLERNLRLNIGENSLSLKVSLAPLRDEEGKEISYLLTFDDLTDLEKAQRLAAWREVARRIAHEIKNPLTPIQLSAQRLRRRFMDRLKAENDADIFEECTEVIIRQVEEMKKLVDEFSRFARLPEIKPRPGDFVLFLEESLALFRQAHKGVHFHLEVKNRPPVFSFDPEQMRRVLTNILDNAVAAMERQGDIFIELEVDELAGLRLSISDTGPGIAPEIRDRIFDPHVSTKEGGQGLGLAIVRTIINDHGGFIKAKSSPGAGARFIIELPLRP